MTVVQTPQQQLATYRQKLVRNEGKRARKDIERLLNPNSQLNPNSFNFDQSALGELARRLMAKELSDDRKSSGPEQP